MPRCCGRLPFATSGEVVRLFGQPPGTTSVPDRNPLQQMEVSRLRERARTLVRLEGFYLSERVVTRTGEPVVAQAAAVTPGLLTMMAAPIQQGRPFLSSEAEPGPLCGRDYRSLLARHPRRGQRARHINRHRQSTAHHRRHPRPDVRRAVSRCADVHAARRESRAGDASAAAARCKASPSLRPGATVAQLRDELAIDLPPARARVPADSPGLDHRARSRPVSGNTGRCARRC